MAIKVLSCYDGMACGLISFEKLGIKVDRYVAYEIDKYAIKTATHNFPMIEEKGDVFNANFKEYENFDFLIGGSPCTYWSIAQKNNRETEASGLGWELFSQYVRALNEAKPKYFIYENNRSMSNAIRDSIRETFGFEEICINSALVSAQNRQRYYWVGKRNEDGTYSKVDIEQPKDEGVLLKDVLESETDLTNKEKGYTLTASYNGACAWNTIERNQRNMVVEPIITKQEIKVKYCDNNNMKTLMRSFGSKAKIVNENIDKSGTLLAAMGTGGGNGIYCAESPYKSPFAEITECQNESPIKVKNIFDNKEYPIYKVSNGKITIKDKEYPIRLQDGYYIIRKLTVTECKRLQTIPEWYEFPVSNSQAYKMLGNGWTVDVICHLIKSVLKGE